MAKSSLRIHADSISGAANRISTAASDTKSSTHSTLQRSEKLAKSGAHAVFAQLVDGVLEKLRDELPHDVELLIESYGKALLDLEDAAGAADRALATRVRSSDTGGGVLAHLPIEGPGSFSNASIAEAAEEYPIGARGGQCRAFVTAVVSKATGGKVNLQVYVKSNTNWDYFTALEQNGKRMTDVSALRPGDIVQIGEFESDPHLHTFIIDGTPYQKPDGTWWVHVVDSNHDPKNAYELVNAYDRPISLSDEERAYRLGTV